MKALFTLYSDWAIVRPESKQFSQAEMDALKSRLSPEQQGMLYWDDEAQGYAMQAYGGEHSSGVSDWRALSFAADQVFELALFQSPK